MAANLPPEVGRILESLFKKAAPSDGCEWINDYVEFSEAVSHGISVSRVHIKDEDMAGLFGRHVGRCSTIQTGPLGDFDDLENVCGCLIEELEQYLTPYKGKTLLICGIGNRDLIVDSIGPETAKRICPQIPMEPAFEKLAVLTPGVSGMTNLSGSTVIASVASSISAACVLTIDSICCTDYSQLCRSLQLTDAGMRIHHTGEELSLSTTGVPVISIGVPTVIRTGDSEQDDGASERDLLTVSNIEAVVKCASLMIACAILQVAYPGLDHAASMAIANDSPL